MTATVRPRDLLVALATFLVVGGVLIHVFVAQRFATTWPDADVVTTSRSAASSVLDTGTTTTRTDVPLVRRSTVVRAVSVVPGTDAYVVSASTTDDDGRVVDRQRWAAVQSTVTGDAVDSPVNAEKATVFGPSGDTVEEQHPLRGVRGVVTRFPRGTEARSYVRYDPESRRSGKAVFVGRRRVMGSTVLVFRQVEEAVPVTSGLVSSRTTLWVRPEIGAIVRTATDVIRTAPDGTLQLGARFVDDAASVRRASTLVDRALDRDRVLGTVVPIVVGSMGLLVALAAVLEGRTGWLEGRLRRRPRG